MSAFPTNWRSILTSRDPKFMVKGHELAVTLYGPASRFAVYEVRTLEADGYVGTRYRVRDAHTVSDADVRSGKRPLVVGDHLSWDEVERLVAHLCEVEASPQEVAA